MKKFIGFLVVGTMALGAGDFERMHAESGVCMLNRNYIAMVESSAQMKQMSAGMPNGEEALKSLADSQRDSKQALDKARADYQKKFGKAFEVARCKTEESFANTKNLDANGADTSRAVAVASPQEIFSTACQLHGMIEGLNSVQKSGMVSGANLAALKPQIEKSRVVLAQLQRDYLARHKEKLDLGKCPKQ